MLCVDVIDGGEETEEEYDRLSSNAVMEDVEENVGDPEAVERAALCFLRKPRRLSESAAEAFWKMDLRRGGM